MCFILRFLSWNVSKQVFCSRKSSETNRNYWNVHSASAGCVFEPPECFTMRNCRSSRWLSWRGSLPSQRLRQLFEPFLQLQRKLLVTLFTNGLHVKLNKLVPAERKHVGVTDLHPAFLSFMIPPTYVATDPQHKNNSLVLLHDRKEQSMQDRGNTTNRQRAFSCALWLGARVGPGGASAPRVRARSSACTRASGRFQQTYLWVTTDAASEACKEKKKTRQGRRERAKEVRRAGEAWNRTRRSNSQEVLMTTNNHNLEELRKYSQPSGFCEKSARRPISAQ